MNTYIKILLGTCCSFSILSCSNNLDETVYSKVTEQTYNYTVDDFTPSIASVYSYLRSQSDHWGYFCAQEVSADAIVMPPNASGWDDGGAYRRMHYLCLYLQPIITQYFIDNKSEIWLLFLIAHSKR